MKTGTLKRVKNISGYVKSKKGRLYTVVILVNSKAGNWKASQLQNNVMKWLVKYKGRGVVMKSNTKSKSIPAKTASVKNGYYIQTGSFAQTPTKAYLTKIKNLGLTYKTEKTTNYKVLVGPYTSESAARTSLKKVRKNINKDAFLVSKTESKQKGAIALY
jgi:D-alanyl-D-alanine carboxypeptidase/D-alanyl-D-alanine-endopeptidase (penicillin-binding protein 4)